MLAVILFAAAALGDLGWRRISNAICLGLAALGLARLAMTAPGWEAALLDLAITILATLGTVSARRQTGACIGSRQGMRRSHRPDHGALDNG